MKSFYFWIVFSLGVQDTRTTWVYSTTNTLFYTWTWQTTLPFLLRPLFLWTLAFHPPGRFVHTSLLPGTHTRWGIFRSKNAPQPLQYKKLRWKKTATQLVTPSPPSPKKKKKEFTYLCPKHACFRVHDNDFEYQVTSWTTSFKLFRTMFTNCTIN